MQKSLLVAMLALGMGTAAQAQTEFKSGNVAIEIQANPFSNSYSTFRLGAGQDQYKLRAKYFMSDKHALRLGIGFSHNTTTTDLGDGYTTTKSEIDTQPNFVAVTNDHQQVITHEGLQEDKTGRFSLDLGYEYHFLTHKRLDLYAGAQLGIFKSFASGTYDKTTTTNDWHSYYPQNSNNLQWMPYTLYTKENIEYSGRTKGGEVSKFGFNVNIFTGANFFIYKGLYAGVELGLAIATAKNCESSSTSVISVDRWNGTDAKVYNHTTTTETNYVNESKDTNVKFYAEPALRLGWMF